MKKLLIHRGALLALVLLSAWFISPAQTESVAGKGEVAVGKQGMATTAHPLASQAAIEMLRKGGNAVDAAVAAAFAIGVVEPDGSGIGGGGGMLIYLAKERKPVYINYYAQASGRVNEVNYNPQTDARSPKAILVPGTVAGLTLALEKHGTLPLSVVLEPAIRYAEQGFKIDQTLGQILMDNVEFIQKDPATASVYLRDGFPLTEGDSLVQPDLARTLRLIAQNGKAGFYEGPVAEALARQVQESGGMMTVEDLKNFKAQISEPVRGTYRGYDIISAAPPQSGISVIEAMNMLENVDLAKLGHFATSTEALHVMAEAMRRMYADRTAFLDDPRSGYVPVKGMTSKAFAKNRFDDINFAMVEPREYRKTKAGNPLPFENAKAPAKAEKSEAGKKVQQWEDDDNDGNSRSKSGDDDDIFNRWGGKKKKKDAEEKPAGGDEDEPSKQSMVIEDKEIGGNLPDADAVRNPRNAAAVAPVKEFAEGGHTTHLSVVDHEGNVVTMTQTLGTFFGSGKTIEGVLLNCAMSNFSISLAVNQIKPNMQPRSSIAPTIILKDGKTFMSVGSPGASRIEATIIELISNVIDHGMDAGEANRAPRFFCQKNDDYLHLEGRIPADVQEGLKKKGHSLRVYGDYDLFFGGAQLILFDQATGKLSGSADPRRGGVAIGY